VNGNVEEGMLVERNARMWMSRLLSPSASPYAPDAATVRTFHAATADTLDVLCHEYSALGMGLVPFETVSYMILEIRSGGPELGSLDRKDKIDRINEVARKLLVMDGLTSWPFDPPPYHWRFQFPTHIGEGSMFTTNPGVNIDTHSPWSDRADGGIRKGRLYFALYKNEEATDGRVMVLNPAKWFNGKSAEQYRNIKPRGAPRR
jgi:hypothetical protein